MADILKVQDQLSELPGYEVKEYCASYLRAIRQMFIYHKSIQEVAAVFGIDKMVIWRALHSKDKSIPKNNHIRAKVGLPALSQKVVKPKRKASKPKTFSNKSKCPKCETRAIWAIIINSEVTWKFNASDLSDDLKYCPFCGTNLMKWRFEK